MKEIEAALEKEAKEKVKRVFSNSFPGYFASCAEKYVGPHECCSPDFLNLDPEVNSVTFAGETILRVLWKACRRN